MDITILQAIALGRIMGLLEAKLIATRPPPMNQSEPGYAESARLAFEINKQLMLGERVYEEFKADGR